MLGAVGMQLLSTRRIPPAVQDVHLRSAFRAVLQPPFCGLSCRMHALSRVEGKPPTNRIARMARARAPNFAKFANFAPGSRAFPLGDLRADRHAARQPRSLPPTCAASSTSSICPRGRSYFSAIASTFRHSSARTDLPALGEEPAFRSLRDLPSFQALQARYQVHYARERSETAAVLKSQA